MSNINSDSKAPHPLTKQHGSWLTEGLMDAEYKEYVLLAWLQKVKEDLNGSRLYPALSNVIDKHRELTAIQKGLEQGKENGPVVGLDFARMQLLRGQMENPSSMEDYLKDVINRALPHLDATMQEGKMLYDLIDSKVKFGPIGIQPLHINEGYLIVTHGEPNGRKLIAYRYNKSRITRGGDAFLELNLQCVESRNLSRLETANGIKWNLIRRYRELPQPATYHVHMEWSIPIEPTLLPIARRRLLQEIAQC
ncbi:MAG: hypothetical protein L7S67_02360 [Flavobacteriales bacterium]|nr:hypothetical protein [Flavobacteriales bacterium]